MAMNASPVLSSITSYPNNGEAKPSSVSGTMEREGILTKSDSRYVIRDGTFNTRVKYSLHLGLLREGIGIPCAYMMSNSKETDNYETFYGVCVIIY